MIGCLTIKHFPAWAISLIRRHDAVRPLIVQEDEHIVALNRAALSRGLEPGMTAARATSVCPDAVLYVRDSVAEFSAWEYVQERLNRITPFIESDPPRIWFGASADEVRAVALYMGASVGFGTHRPTAWMASLQAEQGAMLTVHTGEEDSFLDAFPTRLLALAGFSDSCTDGLQLLGCESVGLARNLNRRHLTLAYGKEGEALFDLIHPTDASPVPLFRPAPFISSQFTLYMPCYQPNEAIPIIHRLAQKAHTDLKSSIVGQIRIVLHLEGYPSMRSARLLTHPTARLDALTRFAERLATGMFQDLQQRRGRIGIERIELELAGLLTGDMIQTNLFGERLRKLTAAVNKVHRRFPRALKRGVVRTGAHFHEDQSDYTTWES
jgi:hypothetical protein